MSNAIVPTPTWISVKPASYDEQGLSEWVDKIRQAFYQDWASLIRYVDVVGSEKSFDILEGLNLSDNDPGAGSIAWTAGSILYEGNVYEVAGGNTADKLVYWDAGDSTLSTGNSFTPQVDRFLIATNNAGTADSAWNKLGSLAVQPGHIPDGSIPGDKLISLTADKLIGGYIATTLLNIKQIIVVGLTLTNNSPSAGKVAWSACTVYYNGNTYSITGSNSSSILIYWDAGNSTFTAADSYAPQTGRFLIATNDSGAGAECWNTLPSKGIQEANLGFTLPGGYQPQTPQSASVYLTTTADSTIYQTTTQRGFVMYIGFDFDAALPAGQEVTVALKSTIDGATPQTIQVFYRFNSGATQHFSVGGVLALRKTGDGTTLGDGILLGLHVPWDQAILLEVSVIQTNMIAGAIRYTLWNAIKQ